MEAISCFALGDGGDAVCSDSIAVSCSRGAVWVAPTVSTSVVSMEGIIHKVFCRVCERGGRLLRTSVRAQAISINSNENEASHRNPNDMMRTQTRRQPAPGTQKSAQIYYYVVRSYILLICTGMYMDRPVTFE
jgi:hypothetical protein